MANSTPEIVIKTEALKPQILSLSSGPEVTTTSGVISPEALAVFANMVTRVLKGQRLS
jgi:hypothetical protein